MDCCDDMKNAQRWKSDLAYWKDRNGDAFIISALYDLIDAIDATIEHHVCKGEGEDVQQGEDQVQQEDVQGEDEVQQEDVQGEDEVQEVDDRDCVPMDCS